MSALVFMLAATLAATQLRAAAPTENLDDFIVTLPSERTALQLGDLFFNVGERSWGGGADWPSAVVYYQFNDNVNNSRRQLMRDAVGQWERASAITFVESSLAPNRILVSDSTGIGCGSSFVGMVGGVQDLLIGCWSVGVIAHELGHAIGYFHEQQRSDRDQFVSFEDTNGLAQSYPSVYAANYGIQAGTQFSLYDFASIMHYPEVGCYTINGLPYCVRISALQAPPVGPPFGSGMECNSAATCTQILGAATLSRRDGYGAAIRYGQRLELNSAGRPIRGTMDVLGALEPCGQGCWRFAYGSAATVTLSPQTGQIGVITGTDCNARGGSPVACTFALDRNMAFIAYTVPTAALIQAVTIQNEAVDIIFASRFE